MPKKSRSANSVLRFIRAYLAGTNNNGRDQSSNSDFLKASASRTVRIGDVHRLTDVEARKVFQLLRWPDTNGRPVCPYCDHENCYLIRTRQTFKCSACRKQFSLTAGTIFHASKLALRDLIAIICMFVDGVKGMPALQLSRQMGLSYKAAFVNLHKIREALDRTRFDMKIGGEIEIDGAYFGGHIRPSNGGREGRRPRNKRRKKCVLVLVRRKGGTVTRVIPSENSRSVLDAAYMHIMPGSQIFADEHKAYDSLHALFSTQRINHRFAYAEGPNGEINTNTAESFNSRIRRGEIGQYHRISGQFLYLYAQEFSYRFDRRRVDNGTIMSEVLETCLATHRSHSWLGYWRKRRSFYGNDN